MFLILFTLNARKIRKFENEFANQHNLLRVNQYDFVAPHSMWIIFLKGLCVLVRVEIIHKSKFLPGTVEKNSSTIYKVLLA